MTFFPAHALAPLLTTSTAPRWSRLVFSLHSLLGPPSNAINHGALGTLGKMGCKVIHFFKFFFVALFGVLGRALTLGVARYLGPVPHDSSYYAKCMLGGVLACGVTHAGITPLDVAKCNMQARPS